MRQAIVIGTLALPVAVLAQSTIAESMEPPRQIPFGGSFEVDMNGDGSADFAFGNGGSLCTTDIPVSSCRTDYYISTLNGSALVVGPVDGPTTQARVVAKGYSIGEDLPEGDGWGIAQGGTLAGYVRNMLEPEADLAWHGPLSSGSDGYLGVAFQAGSEVHYGWIRVRLGESSDAVPEVVGWAYETRPGETIMAGARATPLMIEEVNSTRAGYLRIRWTSEVEVAYQIQSKASLEDSGWTNLDVLFVGTSDRAVVEVPISSSAAFYRVVEAD